MSLSTDGTTLRFIPVRLGDEGLYSCVVSNFAGNATQEMQLFVGSKNLLFFCIFSLIVYF